MRHSWTPQEIAETIEIALMKRAHQSIAIAQLTRRIREGADPTMDTGRVHAAVCAASNCLADQPDAFPKASAELRRQVQALNRAECLRSDAQF